MLIDDRRHSGFLGRRQGVLTAINDFLDRLSEKKLWGRKNCPYQFQMLTKKHNGLGMLTLVSPGQGG